MPSLKEIVDAFLNHQLVERQHDYVRRGRSFRTRTSYYLKAQYIRAVRLYVHGSDPNRTIQEIEDLEAEITLRGESVPSLELLDCEFSRWRLEHMKRLEAGPDAWRKPERRLVACALAFFDNSRRPPGAEREEFLSRRHPARGAGFFATTTLETT
jgi:hypothetical protein